jgi:uncharacterized protein YegL
LEKNPGERFADVSAFLTALYKDKEQPAKETHSAQSSFGRRRLPVYFLLDCSESMAGEPIAALNEAIQMIHQDLMNDPQALETVHISIITFSIQAEQYELLPLDQFRPPPLFVGGAQKAIGDAFRILVKSIEQDLRKNTATQHGDYRPLVFLLTDGSPTDHYHYELQRLHSLRGSHKPTIVALGCGGSVDVEMLHEITENVFLIHTISPSVIRQFFQWISGSIATASRPSISSMEPPINIPGITYSPN